MSTPVPLDVTRADLDDAVRLVHEAGVGPTRQQVWPLLSERLGATVWVKHENHTPTGAFKVRGGLVYVDGLLRREPDVAGLVSATRGNHGQSVAYAGVRAGLPVTIVVPYGNSTEKNAAMRALGARLVEHGEDFDAARAHMRSLAATAGLHAVPSFHRDLVAGVATYAFELLTAVPDLDVLYVPIGLGSGICGCITVRDLLGHGCEIVGVQSASAPAYALSFAAGRVVTTETAATNADGMATRVPDPDALEVIRAGAARIVTVTDDEVAAAVRALWQDTHNLAEGAGAAALAAATAERETLRGKQVGLVLSGGNIDLALFASWVLGGDGRG